MTITYLERADNISPGSAGFGIEGGKAQLRLLIADADLDNAINDLLGDVSQVGDTAGRLARVLPKAHPRFPWLFASHISNLQGRQSAGKVDAEDALEAEPLGSTEAYTYWEATVEFEPRPYALLSDDSISANTLTWYDESGSSTSKSYSEEWLRYSSYEVLPKAELITCQQGQTLFRTQSGASPANKPFSGFPQMRIPTSVIRFTWHQVPASYIDSTNSYITRYQGYINQSTWYEWSAGSLLFDSCEVRRYTPPVPAVGAFESGAVFSAERLCDITFHFIETLRTGTDVPNSVTNSNWIAAGHNLMPWFGDRTFRYCSTDNATAAKQVPPFLSFPFQLLFRDPDAT